MRYYKNGNITTSPTIPDVLVPSHETILANGWYVYVDNPPSYDNQTEKLIRGQVIEGVVQYTVEQLTPEEIQQNEYNQREAERQEQLPKIIENSVQMVIAKDIINGNIPIERIPEFVLLFEEPETGRKYPVDWVLREGKTNELFKLQEETVWDDDDRLDNKGVGLSKREWAENKRANEGEIWVFEEDNFVPKVAHVTEKGKEPNKAPNIWDKL